MTLRHRWLAPLAAALLFAACGGGDPDVPGSGSPSGAPTTRGDFRHLVSFGDSLSDIGTYAPATSLAGNGTPPFFGGKFTTNGTTGTVWVENVAARLGLVVTPAEVGFAGQSVQCPAAADPALATSCTAYGQGGARVTDPNGIGRSAGALTVPVIAQIERHLTRFGGFTANDLVVVYAGNNDIFTQFGTFAARAGQIQAELAAGAITPDQANLALFTAQTAAQAEIKKAAFELGAYVDARILGRGGQYVAVVNLPDSSDTPFGNTLPPSAKQVLSDLCRLFNLWLNEALTGKPVRIIDSFTVAKTVYANPAQFGIVNNTVPACDPVRIEAITGGQVTDGSSLFCNATVGAPFYGLRDGADPQTWQFADGVHPTTLGHRLFSDFVMQQLQSFGWL